MKQIIIFIFMLFLWSCYGNMTTRKQLTQVQPEGVQHYLKIAKHLDQDQQQAMKNGKPFIGMTSEEATLAMMLTEIQIMLNKVTIKGHFINAAGRQYVLFFDYGPPTRVIEWSSFTDKEFEEFTKFQNVYPYTLFSKCLYWLCYE